MKTTIERYRLRKCTTIGFRRDWHAFVHCFWTNEQHEGTNCNDGRRDAHSGLPYSPLSSLLVAYTTRFSNSECSYLSGPAVSSNVKTVMLHMVHSLRGTEEAPSSRWCKCTAGSSRHFAKGKNTWKQKNSCPQGKGLQPECVQLSGVIHEPSLALRFSETWMGYILICVKLCSG